MDACFHAFFLLFSNIIPIFAPVIRLFRYKHNKKNDNLTYKEVRMDFFKEIKNPVKFLRHIYVSITYRIVRIFDRRRDQRVCGCSLTKRYATNVEGGTIYSGTCYWTLEEIFANSEFTNEDSLVDVGCGQGRLCGDLRNTILCGNIHQHIGIKTSFP